MTEIRLLSENLQGNMAGISSVQTMTTRLDPAAVAKAEFDKKENRFNGFISLAEIMSKQKITPKCILNVRLKEEHTVATRDTICEAINNFDTSAFAVVNMTTRGECGFTATLTSEAEAEKMKAALGAISDEIEVKNPPDLELQIRLLDIGPNAKSMTKTNFDAAIYGMNKLILQEGEVTLSKNQEDRFFTVTSTNGAEIHHAILACSSPAVMLKVLKIGKLTFYGRGCFLHEQREMVQCQVCQRLGHFKHLCRAALPTCRHCGELHSLAYCPNLIKPPVCSNCTCYNQLNGTRLATNHRVTNNRCFVKQMRYEGLKLFFAKEIQKQGG